MNFLGKQVLKISQRLPARLSCKGYRTDCKGACLLSFSCQKSRNKRNSAFFNPQGYEFPVSLTTFANGSGRIDSKQLLRLNNYNIFFAFFVNSPDPVMLLI